jgi:tetratricopeptide (TPR) repeat protein
MRFLRKPLVLVPLFLVLLGLGYAGYQLWLARWGQQQLQVAREALQRRDFVTAGTHLTRYLDVWPDDPGVRLEAAQTFRRGGNISEALKHLNLVKQPEALALERMLLRMQQPGKPGTPFNSEEPKRLLDRVRSAPNAPESHWILEVVLMGTLARLRSAVEQTIPSAEGDQDEALGVARQALELWGQTTTSPADRAQGMVWGGRVAWAAGDYPKAIAAFREALELAPEHHEARAQLAMAIAQEAPAEAVRHLQYLVERDPGNVNIRFWLATARMNLGQFDEARQLFDSLLAENPNNVSTLIERGLLAVDLYQVGEAETYLRRALALAPNQPEVHLALSRCYHAAGKTEEAAKAYNKFTLLEAKRKR